MKIKLTTGMWWQGVIRYDGDVVEMPDDVAQRYIDTRQAEPLDEPQPVETAALRTTPARGKHDGRLTAARR
jgi:hypothetical protein